MDKLWTHIITILLILVFLVLKLKSIDTIVDAILLAIIGFYYGYQVMERKIRKEEHHGRRRSHTKDNN